MNLESAIELLYSGDLLKLRETLEKQPALLTARADYDEALNYFSGATLLHHVAGNPFRVPLPLNIVGITALLLELGADPDARTLSGSTVAELILTSRAASDAGVGVALLDALREGGATCDWRSEDAILPALRNCAPGTAQDLFEQGYPVGLRGAAGLGQLEIVRQKLAESPDQTPLDEALTYATIGGHHAIMELLLDHGANIDSIPNVYGNPGTALHIAPNAPTAKLLISRLLISRGASLTIEDPTFGGTPAGWAEHGESEELQAFYRDLE